MRERRDVPCFISSEGVLQCKVIVDGIYWENLDDNKNLCLVLERDYKEACRIYNTFKVEQVEVEEDGDTVVYIKTGGGTGTMSRENKLKMLDGNLGIKFFADKDGNLYEERGC